MNKNCRKCKDAVADGVVCHGCDSVLHYQCSGLSEATYRKMNAEKKAVWRCVPCRTGPPVTDPSASEPSLSELLLELRSFRADFNKLDLRFQKIEASLSSITKTQSEQEVTIRRLENDLNHRDQLSRMNNVEIVGVPFSKGENLYNLLRDISAKVAFDLQDSDVDFITRVRRYPEAPKNSGGKPKPREPAIIIRFCQRRRKDQLIAAVRSRRDLTSTDLGFSGPASNIFVQEHLTRANKLLLNSVRLFKNENNYAFVWVKDCKILLRKSELSPIIRISGEADLQKLK